jgi:hypothetical protein
VSCWFLSQGASALSMDPPKPKPQLGGLPRQVVYVPACVTRMMGVAPLGSESASVHEKLMSLFEKAGYEVILPKVGLTWLMRSGHACTLDMLDGRQPVGRKASCEAVLPKNRRRAAWTCRKTDTLCFNGLLQQTAQYGLSDV